MVVFEIRNSAENDMLLGYLLYYARSKRFFAEILDGIDEWSAPFIFSGLVKKGIRSIDSNWTGKFVRQRIIPSDRQNLGNILRDNGLKNYDEFKLLTLSEGRCSQDELYLVRIPEKEIRPEIDKRQKEKVLEVMPLRTFKALVFFRNDESSIVDIKDLCGKDPAFGNILRSEERFGNIRVSPGGNGIEWGEERFIPAETLKRHGTEAHILYEDILRFIRERLIDTAQASGILNCSRQYIDQLANRERLVPVREGLRSTLYMKSALEAEVFL